MLKKVLCAGISCAFGLAGSAQAATGLPPQLPGPSQALFDTPYYACSKNFYVSVEGSDESGDGSTGKPWATLQHTNNELASVPRPGTCVNVEASSTPYSGTTLTSGGNAAASGGYLVWRCTVMLGCTVKTNAGANGNGGFLAIGTGVANYVMIDGFNIAGNNSVYNVGVGTGSEYGSQAGVFSSHHFWVLNSSVYNNGQAGIAFASGDYTYAIHNRVFDNAAASSCDNGAQGSGIGNVIALDINRQYPGYAATADDKVNPSSMIGGLIREDGQWFHNVYMFNVVYNNHVSPCTPSGGDTDGNGIILDTLGTRSDGTGNVVDYPDMSLVAFNVVLNNGGGGIHIFDSEYVTVANNTVYNNGLDPYLASGDSGIDTNGSYGNTIINNITASFPAKPNGGVCSFSGKPGQQFNNAILGGVRAGYALDRFSNNLSVLKGGNNSCWGAFGQDAPTGENPMFNGDSYSCIKNKCATPPQWASVGKTFIGTESTLPSDTNFALSPGSPAIGYGLAKPYLLPQSVDAGACSAKLVSCP